MRIQGLINIKNNNYKNLKNNQARFERKNNTNAKPTHHKYTGDACRDLAYASLFDYEIAKDLKIMGLI